MVDGTCFENRRARKGTGGSNPSPSVRLLVDLRADEVTTQEEAMTLEEIRDLAEERGVPGPDLEEHEEGYDEECYCRLCLSYL